MGLKALREFDPVAVRQIQDGLQETARPIVRACLREHESRRGRPNRRFEGSLSLEVTSKDGRASIVVESFDATDGDADDEIRRCFEDAFGGADMELEDRFDFVYRIRYPIAIRAPSQD